MILGSHNSWSYLPPKKWYMKPLRFTAQCQDWDIKTQYEHGVRCFDLRLRYDKDTLQVVHGEIIFKITCGQLLEDLGWLNAHKDVYVRVIHDVRTKKQYEKSSRKHFKNDCAAFEKLFKNIKFYNAQNLYNRETEYDFKNNPTCLELYSSVVGSKVDDLYPRYYAKKNNKKIYQEGTTKQILMIDFVNYVV